MFRTIGMMVTLGTTIVVTSVISGIVGGVIGAAVVINDETKEMAKKEIIEPLTNKN